MSPAQSLLPCSTSETRKEKRGDPHREASRTQTEPGWGRLSCTQGNVMTKQHIPQFSGGRGKPPGKGASPQCRPALCHADTVCSSILIPQPSGPQPHPLNWSTQHNCSSYKQHYARLHHVAKTSDIYINVNQLISPVFISYIYTCFAENLYAKYS